MRRGRPASSCRVRPRQLRARLLHRLPSGGPWKPRLAPVLRAPALRPARPPLPLPPPSRPAAPPPGPPVPLADASNRQYSVRPRTGGTFNPKVEPVPGTDEKAIIVTGGVILNVRNAPNIGLLDIEADR